MLQPPERPFKLPNGDWVVLRGNFHAGMNYRTVTGGKDGSSLEEAWDSLRPQLLEHELATAEGREPVRVVSRDVWDTMFMDLFFAFAADWRLDHRWDAKHRRDEDPDELDPRFRGPYIAFARMFPYTVLRKLRPVVFGLLSESLSDPSEAAGQGEDERPTASESPAPTNP